MLFRKLKDCEAVIAKPKYARVFICVGAVKIYKDCDEKEIFRQNEHISDY